MGFSCVVGNPDENNDEYSPLDTCESCEEAIPWGVMEPESKGDADLYK